MARNSKETTKRITGLFSKILLGIIPILFGAATVWFGILNFPEIKHGYIGYVLFGLFIVIPYLGFALMLISWGIVFIIDVIKKAIKSGEDE